MINVKLESENNNYFRKWIIEEWKHHNTVDPIYKLIIKKPEEVKFEKNERYYKIMFQNEEVGFVGIKNYDSEIYLYRFYIMDSYRNQGIGTEALNQLIDLAKKQNKDISLEVMGNNGLAKKLYEKVGFKTHYTKMVLKITDKVYIDA